MTFDSQSSLGPSESPRIDERCEFQSCVDLPTNATLEDHHLILDLDHTLISSFEFGESQASRIGVNTVSPILAKDYVDEYGLPEMYHATISSIVVLIKLRPHVRRFIRTAAASGITLHVYTKGRRAYMREIVRLIDPDGVIKGRHLSRDDEPSHLKDYQKDPTLIDESFGSHSTNITVLDDSPHVWSSSEHYADIIAAKRYTFTDGFVSFLRSNEKTVISQYPRDSDTFLHSLFEQVVLRKKAIFLKFSERTMTTSTSASEDLAPLDDIDFSPTSTTEIQF